MDPDQVQSAAEAAVLDGYRPPAPIIAPLTTVHYVRRADNRSVVVDHHGRPLTVDRLLATKPLQSELCSRPGPGNKRLTYLSGESVTRILNDVFGFDGWRLEIIRYEQTEKTHISNTKWHVAYIAQVRITLEAGVYKEDLGAGDAMDRQLSSAVAHALKSSVTDAMKRAARHFGDRLGNSLYDGQFNLKNAPKTMQEALDEYDKRMQERFSIKDTKPPTSVAAPISSNNIAAPPAPPAAARPVANAYTKPGAPILGQPQRPVSHVEPPVLPASYQVSRPSMPAPNVPSNHPVQQPPQAMAQQPPALPPMTVPQPLSATSIGVNPTPSSLPPPRTAAEGLHSIFDDDSWLDERPETSVGRRSSPGMVSTASAKRPAPSMTTTAAPAVKKLNPYQVKSL